MTDAKGDPSGNVAYPGGVGGAFVPDNQTGDAPWTAVHGVDITPADKPPVQPLGIEGADRFAAAGGLTPAGPSPIDVLPFDQAGNRIMPPDLAPPAPSTYGENFDAMLRRTDVATALDYLSRPVFPAVPGYNPYTDPQVKGTGYEQYNLDDFVTSQSPAETADIISRINRKNADLSIFARGGFAGVTASYGEGFLSPFMLLPMGGLLKTAEGVSVGARVALRAGEMAALSGAATAGQQAVYGATDVERQTPGEVAFSIGYGVILGGILGAASAGMSPGHIDALGEGLAHIPASDAEAAASFHAGVGAAVSSEEAGSGIVKGSFGIGTIQSKAPIFSDPLTRSLYSPSREARLVNRQLNEIPVQLEDNALGVPTSPGGSAQAIARLYDVPLDDALANMDAQFKQYRFGTPDARIGHLRAGIADVTGQAGGKMGFGEFDREVYRAMYSGDVHPVPEVEAAAREFRAKLEEPLKKEAIEVGIFPEDVKPGDDVSHVFRMWDHDRVAADRVGLADALVEDFSARQAGLKFNLDKVERELAAKRDAEAAKSPDLFAGTAKAPEPKPIVLPPGHAEARQFADMTAAEVRSVAEESINNILGFSPGRTMLPKDIIGLGVRGPLKERLLRIETSKVLPWVVQSAAQSERAAVRTMATDIALMKKFGSLDLVAEQARINDDFANMIRENPGQSKKLTNAQQVALDDLKGMLTRMRGLYAMPTTARGQLLHRAARTMLSLNFLAKLGNVTVSSISDVGKPIMNFGLNRVMATAFHPLVNGLTPVRLARADARLLGQVVERASHARQMNINNIMDNFGRSSRFEKGVQWMSDRFGSWSLMSPWNQFFKEVSGALSISENMQAIERVVAGKATKAEIEGLAANSIDANMAERIWKQFNGGEKSSTAKINYAPAVKINGKIYTGGSHVDAIDRAAKVLNMSVEDIANEHASGNAFDNIDGFVDSDGNFVDRATAYKAADVGPSSSGGHGTKDGEIYIPNAADWTDRQAFEAMSFAVQRDVNRTIVTPGQDKPFWMSTPIGAVIGQFHSFNIASVQRTLMAGLQQRDAAALNGAMVMLGLGWLSYYLKSQIAGYDTSNDNWQTHALNAFDNSGLAGWIMDANNVATKLSGGAASIQRLVGAKEPSRYQSQDVAALLGPTATTTEAIASLVGAMGHDRWTQSMTHKVRSLIPLQNLFYLRWLFDAAERGVNGAFGIRKKAA